MVSSVALPRQGSVDSVVYTGDSADAIPAQEPQCAGETAVDMPCQES